MGGNFPGGNYLGGNFPGGDFVRENLIVGNSLGGNFPGGSFPNIILSVSTGNLLEGAFSLWVSLVSRNHTWKKV